MVLWEITLGTAYFLGLKRTYRLALRIQQRLISPKHARVRQFVRGYFFVLIYFAFFFSFFFSGSFFAFLKVLICRYCLNLLNNQLDSNCVCDLLIVSYRFSTEFLEEEMHCGSDKICI